MHYARENDWSNRLSDKIIERWHERNNITDSQLLQLIEKVRESNKIELDKIGSMLREVEGIEAQRKEEDKRKKTLAYRIGGLNDLRNHTDWLRGFARENPSIQNREEKEDEFRLRAFTKLGGFVINAIDAEEECVTKYLQESEYSAREFGQDLIESKTFIQSDVPEIFRETDYFSKSDGWFTKFRLDMIALINIYQKEIRLESI